MIVPDARARLMDLLRRLDGGKPPERSAACEAEDGQGAAGKAQRRTAESLTGPAAPEARLRIRDVPQRPLRCLRDDSALRSAWSANRSTGALSCPTNLRDQTDAIEYGLYQPLGGQRIQRHIRVGNVDGNGHSVGLAPDNVWVEMHGARVKLVQFRQRRLKRVLLAGRTAPESDIDAARCWV